MQPIESIKVNDVVLSRNDVTGSNEYKRVLELFQLETYELMTIVFGNSEIKVTPIHRFYVENKGWVEAGKLGDSEVLVNHEGKRIIITKIKRIRLDKPVRVYNIGVEDNHNYYVSTDTVLVHNLKSNGDMLSNPGFQACFEGETYVKGNSGNISMKDVRIGDMIKTINPKTCKIELRRVTKKYGAKTDDYYVLTVRGEQLEQIICTENHKFMVAGRGWVEAKALKEQDILMSENADVHIEGINHIHGQEAIKVYNIELDENQNYEVGELGLFVVDRWNSKELSCKKNNF
jgi:hypothetical protein